MPVYAHAPLPDDFAERVFRPIADLPEDRRKAVLKSLVAEIEPGAKGLVTQQLNSKTASRGGAVPLSDQRLDPDSPEMRKRADELDEEDPIAAAAHPFAYGLDSALDDAIGEDGLFGDWGHRRSIPKPSGEASGAAGDAIRLYLLLGAPLGGALKAVGTAGSSGARLRKILDWAVKTRGGRALSGGGLSAAAEWAVKRGKASPWDIGVALASGAVSGGITLTKGKAYVADVGMAIGSSLLNDALNGKELSMARAAGAGLGAALFGLGVIALDEWRLGTQAGARLARKYGEEYLQKYFVDVFNKQLELTKKEWDEFWKGLEAYARRQWDEFVQTGDTNPFD